MKGLPTVPVASTVTLLKVPFATPDVQKPKRPLDMPDIESPFTDGLPWKYRANAVPS